MDALNGSQYFAHLKQPSTNVTTFEEESDEMKLFLLKTIMFPVECLIVPCNTCALRTKIAPIFTHQGCSA